MDVVLVLHPMDVCHRVPLCNYKMCPSTKDECLQVMYYCVWDADIEQL
jgi:hypothetical protein